jgi:hypothetical protein
MRPQPRRISTFLLALTVLVWPARGDDGQEPANPKPDAAVSRVYGEWRIRVRPDQGPAYNRLIEQSGLPLFRGAGARMVGWWNTLVGDLYEHVTIWEYDDMAAFERAIGILGNDPAFARFVAARDPLLAGEESRFLRPAPEALPPALPDPAAFVVHEVHRVPLARRDAYLAFMTKEGLGLLKKHGFRPVGPWGTELGRWTEVTYLFRFESLAERERLIAQFSATNDARTYGAKVAGFAEEVTTRLLVPAPFAKAATPKTAASTGRLPHFAEITPGVFVAGFSAQYGSTNCGWVAMGAETLLIDVPRGIPVPEFLKIVSETTGEPPRSLVLTQFRDDDASIIKRLSELAVRRLVTTPEIQRELENKLERLLPPVPPNTAAKIGDDSVAVEFRSMDGVVGEAGGIVYLPGRSVLFGGPLVVHGPRAPLPSSDTGRWVEVLRRLEVLAPAHVVPGSGTWGGPEVLARQRRLLAELRRQVGYHVAQGRPLATLREQVRLPAEFFAWMPYDTPTAEDLEHVYRELTVPVAPFHGREPDRSDPRPHVLALIGDQPHEPGHIEDGLRPVFEQTGVIPHFTVDVKSLSARNLGMVKLLVILRDGLQRPDSDRRTNFVWMTPEQQQAVADFVEAGGGFLNLHNSMGLYPPQGPYLELVGGRYTGHGPLERFRVEVVDADHPITRGVGPFFVADEQHTPVYDDKRVHLLLRSRSDDGKVVAAAGWVREPGRGRLCHLAPGHTREALLHPMYQRLLRNAVTWCLRMGDPGSAQ